MEIKDFNNIIFTIKIKVFFKILFVSFVFKNNNYHFLFKLKQKFWKTSTFILNIINGLLYLIEISAFYKDIFKKAILVFSTC